MKILVLCSANRGRSPVLASLLRHSIGTEDHLILSAGTNVNKWKLAGKKATEESVSSVLNLTNKQVDITGHRATPIESYNLDSFDVVITLSDRAEKWIKNDFSNNIRKYYHMHFVVIDPFDFGSMSVICEKHEECIQQMLDIVPKIVSELNLVNQM